MLPATLLLTSSPAWSEVNSSASSTPSKAAPVGVLLRDDSALLDGIGRRNGEILAAEARIAQASADVGMSRLVLPNPTADFALGGLTLGRTNPAGLGFNDTSSFSLGLSQTIEIGKRGPRMEAADLRLKEASKSYTVTLSDTLADARFALARVDELTVVSPRDGVLVEKNILPAQQVNVESGLVEVADLSQVWVVAELFEAAAAGILVGTKAKIPSPSLPDLALEAKVDMVSAVVDPTRHTVPLRVRLDNEKHLLKPSVFVQMRFAVEPPHGSGEVAASALVSDGARQYVYVQTDHGRLTRREVIAGSARENRVPILSGLEPGEIVVEEGAILLDNQIALAH